MRVQKTSHVVVKVIASHQVRLPKACPVGGALRDMEFALYLWYKVLGTFLAIYHHHHQSLNGNKAEIYILAKQNKKKSLTGGDKCEECIRQRAAEKEGGGDKDQSVIIITVINGGKRPLGVKSESSIVLIQNHC